MEPPPLPGDVRGAGVAPAVALAVGSDVDGVVIGELGAAVVGVVEPDGKADVVSRGPGWRL